MQQKRIESIDIIRGIAILLMMVGHIAGIPIYVDKYIHMFHMPIWFFISGWFYKRRNKLSIPLIEDHSLR